MKRGEDYVGITIVFLCHDGTGNYVLQKRGVNCRDEHGRWDSGGGALEWGDSVEDTLRKEIKEEFGTEPLSYEFLGFHEAQRENNGKKNHWLALDFKVLVDPSTVTNAEPHKFDEIAWFSLSEFPTPLHSQFPKFLEKYKEKL